MNAVARLVAGRLALAAIPIVFGILVILPCISRAQEPVYTLTITGHRFEPREIEIPAGTKVALVVRNLDVTPERFDSTQLRRENVLAPGQEVTIYIGPLRPGRYEFFGHFHPGTARGHVVAK